MYRDLQTTDRLRPLLNYACITCLTHTPAKVFVNRRSVRTNNERHRRLTPSPEYSCTSRSPASVPAAATPFRWRTVRSDADAAVVGREAAFAFIDDDGIITSNRKLEALRRTMLGWASHSFIFQRTCSHRCNPAIIRLEAMTSCCLQSNYSSTAERRASSITSR